MSYAPMTVRPEYERMSDNSITNLDRFIALCLFATNDEIYHMFENGPCTKELCCEIYELVPADACEPFREAMTFLGFEDY